MHYKPFLLFILRIKKYQANIIKKYYMRRLILLQNVIINLCERNIFLYNSQMYY